MPRQLLDVREMLRRVDHQTHRRYGFTVAADCRQLRIRVGYTPKHLSAADSVVLAEAARVRQTAELAARVGAPLAARWSADVAARTDGGRIANLLTVTLDDAVGAYRGAAHRHANPQELVLGLAEASPGLVAGPLPPGAWAITLSVHTLVSPQCALSIQIAAETASRR